MQGDNQFRVKLILGHYFADHKANSYICVNRDWNTVKDLHLHIKNLFDIDGFVLKTTENVYLPDKENINVIQRGDDISAIPHDVAKNGAKMSSVNTIRSDNQRKSMDSFNPFSPPKSTDKDPTHTNLKASEKCLKPSNVNDGDGLLDVRRRKRTRKHKNSKDKSKTDSNGGDTSVSELSPKIRSSKIINVSAERKMNGTSKPTANKHVRFDEDGLSEQDDEVDLPKKARIVAANVAGEVAFRFPTILTERKKEILETSLMETTVIENPISEAAISDYQEEATDAQPESALEQLAKNLETVGKYKELIEEAKPNDIIAFKVFTPNFEKSGYVIGLVESINTRNNPNDYDLILSIMAGSVHIEHLTEFDENNANQNIQIGINRMDLFDAKVIEL